MQVQTFAQLLPRSVYRVDGDLSSTASGSGAGSVNTDIAILDTGIQISLSDFHEYRQKTFVSGTSSANDDIGHGTWQEICLTAVSRCLISSSIGDKL